MPARTHNKALQTDERRVSSVAYGDMNRAPLAAERQKRYASQVVRSENMGIILETDRLMLREWAPEDADAAFGIWGNAEVMRFVGQPFETIAAARRALANATAAQKECGFCLWAVVERSSGKIIGCCGFHAYEGRAVLELAYHFVPSSWGVGYATEAAAACVKYGFEDLGATRIVAFTQPENVASCRVLEKLGMKHQGLVCYEGAEEKMYELSRTREA